MTSKDSNFEQSTSLHPYQTLTPDAVIDAVESQGVLTDMRQYPLNSYENRVYQVGIEEDTPIIVKFYRPNRWSKDAILEEHKFLLELAEEDLPVVAPLEFNGTTLFEYKDFYFSISPRKSGHSPEIANRDQLEYLGRWLARLHQVGRDYRFKHRPIWNGQADLGKSPDKTIIEQSCETVLNSGLMNEDFRPAYESLCRDLNEMVKQQYQPEMSDTLRIHGDCHVGNLLWRDEQLYMVDFDDSVQGPAMQDIWMLLSGQREEQIQQLESIRNGYEVFQPFPYHQLKWIECLRTIRLIKHTAWIAERWSDPAFPIAFPWFEDVRYWSEHVLCLREQFAALQQEPLFIHD